MALAAIQNRRLYSQIADQLAELIGNGAYPPGDYLPPERELAARLGVSRSSVREGLIALEVLGIVDVRVGDGVLVLKTLPEGSRESLMRRVMHLTRPGPDPELPVALDLEVEIPPFALLRARRLIEPETAALAATRATTEQLAGIEAALARNHEDNRLGSATHPGDRLFHIRIAGASGNAAYEQFMILLLGHRYGAMFQRLQRLYASTDMPRRSEREHEAVWTAIQGGRPEEARAAMALHLDTVIEIFSRE
jgi:GntR family transcriptional repressor for pyruvate dehydrogenase complex